LFKTDIKTRLGLKFAKLLKMNKDPEKEVADQIKILSEQLSFETKDIIQNMSSHLRNSMMKALQHSKGTLIYI